MKEHIQCHQFTWNQIIRIIIRWLYQDMPWKYVAGDMNEANSGFQRWKVFHYNNITIEDQISLATNILDHPILIGKARINIGRLEQEKTVRVLQIKDIDWNNKQLVEASFGRQVDEMKDPSKLVEKIHDSEIIDEGQMSEQYSRLKKETKIKSKQEWQERYNDINILFTTGRINDYDWVKINKTFLIKSSKIWNGSANEKRITEDFKKLYKHGTQKIWKKETCQKLIKELIAEIDANREIFQQCLSYILLSRRHKTLWVLNKGLLHQGNKQKRKK